MASNSVFDLRRLRAQLKALHFRLHYAARLRSTNDHAAVLRRRRTLHAPAVVLTACQTAGRGRGDNVWFSNRDVLTVTFVLPEDDVIPPHELPLLAGLAVRNAAARLTANPDIALKWPNDIYLDGRKLAGLLCERLDGVDLIGVGLNVNLDPRRAPVALRAKVTSLLTTAGRDFPMTDVLLAIANELQQVLLRRRDSSQSAMLREYGRHHMLVGRQVRVSFHSDPPQEGLCEGLDSHGRLLLRTSRGTQVIVAGHIDVL